MSSFFSGSMGKLLIGAAVGKGSSLVGDYFSDTFMQEGSFLSNIYEEYIDPYNPFGTADEVRDASGKLIKSAVSSGAQALIAQGLGLDPATGQGMPNINIPRGDTFRSKNNDFRAKNYGGFPQGNARILENAFKDPAMQQMAYDYKQSRMPSINYVKPTVSMGGSTIGGLDKGMIRSVKS